jgi:F-type H+-transporting ATPase subunit epsilon
MTVKIIVITPERIVWNTTADEVILPGLEGQIGILTNHAPLITALEIGVLRLKLGDTKKALILLGGFAEVEDNEITVLVNGVEEITDIDLPAARAALATAMEELDQTENDKDKIQALQKLKKVMARVQAMTYL